MEVENGYIEKVNYYWRDPFFHFHDYGRKGKDLWTMWIPEESLEKGWLVWLFPSPPNPPPKELLSPREVIALGRKLSISLVTHPATSYLYLFKKKIMESNFHIPAVSPNGWAWNCHIHIKFTSQQFGRQIFQWGLMRSKKKLQACCLDSLRTDHSLGARGFVPWHLNRKLGMEMLSVDFEQCTVPSGI